jgi:hypothetical protein
MQFTPKAWWFGYLSRYSHWLLVYDPGNQSRLGQDFPQFYTKALGLTQPPVQWVPVFFRGKNRPGRDADPLFPSSAVVKKG